MSYFFSLYEELYPKQEAKQDVEVLLVVFPLGNAWYGFPAEEVLEIASLPRPRALPGLAKHFLGIVNLRGSILSIIDLRGFLGIHAELSPVSQMIVIEYEKLSTAIVVDGAAKILQIESSQIEKAPILLEQRRTGWIEGFFSSQERLIGILNAAKVLEDTRFIPKENIHETLAT